jgi:hypothetical protein
MNRLTFGMAVLLGTVAMLSAGLAAAAIHTTMIQEASVQDTDFNFEQEKENKCSGSATCSNTATITFDLPSSDNPDPSIMNI